jgi:hypothetical protein
MALLRRTAPFAGHGFLQPIACPESHGIDCLNRRLFHKTHRPEISLRDWRSYFGSDFERKTGWRNGQPGLDYLG